MTPAGEPVVLTVSRPSFRALLFACALGDRELDLYAEALPDSPDHNWSILQQDLRRWTRPRGLELTPSQQDAVRTALLARIEADGLRLRWD